MTIKSGKLKLRTKTSQRVNTPGGKNSAHLLLLDAYGHPPYTFKKDVIVVNENLGRFILGEKMKIELRPPPNEPEKAIQMVIGGLIAASASYNAWRKSWPTIGLDSWVSPCAWVIVSARPQSDNEVIYATWSPETRTLTISLPHTTMWRKSGLLWLGTQERCCVKNERNPTPWVGKSCQCDLC
jgi:hypothetical protein